MSKRILEAVAPSELRGGAREPPVQREGKEGLPEGSIFCALRGLACLRNRPVDQRCHILLLIFAMAATESDRIDVYYSDSHIIILRLSLGEMHVVDCSYHSRIKTPISMPNRYRVYCCN